MRKLFYCGLESYDEKIIGQVESRLYPNEAQDQQIQNLNQIIQGLVNK